MKYLPVITFREGKQFHILVLIYSDDIEIGSSSVVVFYEKGNFIFKSLVYVFPTKALSICPEEEIKKAIKNYLKRLYG